MDYIQNLVCPKCKSRLEQQPGIIICEACKAKYPIIDNIPIFCEHLEKEKWTQYHIQVYTPKFKAQNANNSVKNIILDQDNYLSTPLFENDYYSKFVEYDSDRILDLGSGDGVFSAPLVRKAKEIYCVDPSYVALKRVIMRNKSNMYPINASGESLPFPNNFFDYVLFIFVIEHIADPQHILNEIRRVLKPNGHLIVSTDSKYYYHYFRIMIELLKNRTYQPDDPTHINLMTPKELRAILEKYFLDDLEEIHYFALNRKINYLPRFISESFLSSLMIHKCRPR